MPLFLYFKEGELDESMVVRKFRTTSQHGAIEGKTQENELLRKGITMNDQPTLLRHTTRYIANRAFGGLRKFRGHLKLQQIVLYFK